MISFNLEKKISKTLRTFNFFFGTKHPAAHGVFCQIEFNEASVPWQIGFQDPATPIMEEIIDLHHDIMFFIIVIIVFVSWLLFKLSYTYKVPYEANSLV
jgi:heme/copper-type cytochrome/quinol oxidase subunit 2